MATITTINGSDNISTSDTVINTNFANLNSDKIETSVLDTDTTLAANSDAKIATQKAVKAYVDAGGNVNASETTKGIVEEATDAEVLAGTATGATGAKLFVTPAKLTTRLSYVNGKIEIDTTDFDLTNNTTETTAYDVSIPAGTLSTNNGVRFKIWCDNFTMNNGDTFTVRLKYGSTTVATAVNATGFNTNATGMSGWIEGCIVANASASAQKGYVSYFFSQSDTEVNADAAVGIGKIFASGSGTATENSANALTMSVTVDYSAAAAGNTISLIFWVVEKIV